MKKTVTEAQCLHPCYLYVKLSYVTLRNISVSGISRIVVFSLAGQVLGLEGQSVGLRLEGQGFGLGLGDQRLGLGLGVAGLVNTTA